MMHTRYTTVGLLVASMAGPALAAETIPITQPGTYSEPGNYYLANDITITHGAALTFASKGRQEVNLNGKTIRCLTNANDVTIGIEGQGSVNLIIFGGGGSWIDGCRIGVSSNNPWTRIQEVIFRNIKYIAMHLRAHTARVILCEVEGVGGVSDEAYAVAVNVAADGAIIRGNRFVNVFRQAGADGHAVGEGVAIVLNSAAKGALVEHNYIVNDIVAADSIGVFAGEGGGHTIRKNAVRNFDQAIAMAGTSSAIDNTIKIDGPSPDVFVGISATSFGQALGNIIVGYPEDQSLTGLPTEGNTIVPWVP